MLTWYLLSLLVIILTALSGLVLTIFIARKKKLPEPMVCPLGQDCSSVLHSEYSKFLGVPLEYLGMLYYGFILVCYVLYLVLPGLQESLLTLLTFPLTFGAFVFSLYLTFIQAFTLREWCTWCLSSAGMTSIIFLVALYASQCTIFPLLEAYAPVVFAIHMIGLALGLGATTMADVFFLRFFKDFRI
jgi:uncharacterized membrane protein